MDAVRRIAETVLYEGYILWPYRRSAMKNRQRWTFGGVYPRSYSEAAGTNDPWMMQTQCLVLGDGKTAVEAKVRFLHVVERRAARRKGGAWEFVDELVCGGERHLSWEEAAEREVSLGSLTLAGLASPVRAEIDIPAGSKEEPLAEQGCALVRSWQALSGTVEAVSGQVQEGLFRLTVRITNTTPWEGGDRESALRRTFVSTHTVLEAREGEFVSLTDPPEELREAAEACENIKTWPVLVGEEGRRDVMLSSPIILYDYPQVAPESPGDLFDGTEIDQLLTLSIMGLTEEEKEEMRASDPRVREILERTESLSAEELMRLHGTIREFRMLRRGAE